jgi:hypothetical protein
MPRKRDVAVEELQALASDLKSLVTTLTTDPKEQARKERAWKLLYGGLSAVFALVARRFATKSWGVLTGERPPAKKQPGRA